MKIIGEVYLHVGNSGATFKVVDAGNGPELIIETSALGNLNQVTKIKTTRASMQALKELFAKADEHPSYSLEYCHAADVPGTGGTALVGSGPANVPVEKGSIS